jgi:hypothetical protein
MNLARADAHRTRFRRPLKVAVTAYKASLGLSEIVVGVLLAVPSFDPQVTFARLSAEELREDPGDHLVALVSRRHRSHRSGAPGRRGTLGAPPRAAPWEG